MRSSSEPWVDDLVTFDDMIGSTIASIVGGKTGSEELVFESSTGDRFRFWYEHDCCAGCVIEDIAGDMSDLVGSPILGAEEVSHDDPPGYEYSDSSHTWTFYRFWTAKGHVTIRWLGESNGYYSESVSFEKIGKQ